MQTWRIQARVLEKGILNSFQRKTGEGKIFSAVVVDKDVSWPLVLVDTQTGNRYQYQILGQSSGNLASPIGIRLSL